MALRNHISIATASKHLVTVWKHPVSRNVTTGAVCGLCLVVLCLWTEFVDIIASELWKMQWGSFTGVELRSKWRSGVKVGVVGPTSTEYSGNNVVMTARCSLVETSTSWMSGFPQQQRLKFMWDYISFFLHVSVILHFETWHIKIWLQTIVPLQMFCTRKAAWTLISA